MACRFGVEELRPFEDPGAGDMHCLKLQQLEQLAVENEFQRQWHSSGRRKGDICTSERLGENVFEAAA